MGLGVLVTESVDRVRLCSLENSQVETRERDFRCLTMGWGLWSTRGRGGGSGGRDAVGAPKVALDL